MTDGILENDELEMVWLDLRPLIKDHSTEYKNKVFTMWMMARESNDLCLKTSAPSQPQSNGNEFQTELLDNLKKELLAMSFEDANEFLQIAMACLANHKENATGDFPVVYYP